MRMAWRFSCTGALGLFGLVAACSDPVAPASQASVSLYLTTVSSSGMPLACPASPHWVNVPYTKTLSQQSFATAKGPLAVDGQDGMGVSCSIKDNGGSFAVSATLRSPATNPTTGMPINPTLVNISTNIATDGQAQGTVTVLDDKTTSTYSSADDMGQSGATCLFNVKANPNEQLGVAPGRIWATVTCPRFRDSQSSNLGEVCQISQGIVILENCSQ